MRGLGFLWRPHPQGWEGRGGEARACEEVKGLNLIRAREESGLGCDHWAFAACDFFLVAHKEQSPGQGRC